MKNIIILLVAMSLSMLVPATLIEMQRSADVVPVAPADTDAMNFWDIFTEDIRAEDPAGWDSFLGREQTPELSAELEAWAMIQRRAIFLRRYGRPFGG